jgi:hypothetical protein
MDIIQQSTKDHSFDWKHLGCTSLDQVGPHDIFLAAALKALVS